MTKREALAKVVRRLGGTPVAGGTADLIDQLAGLVTSAQVADADLTSLQAQVSDLSSALTALQGEVDDLKGGGEG